MNSFSLRVSLTGIFKGELYAREIMDAIDNAKIVLKAKIFSLLKLRQITVIKMIILKSLKKKNKFVFLVKVRTIFDELM